MAWQALKSTHPPLGTLGLLESYLLGASLGRVIQLRSRHAVVEDDRRECEEASDPAGKRLSQ